MKKILIFLFPVLFFCGCGVWDDFTTFFNLYYDTSDIFSQAEKLIKEQKRDIFSNEEIPLPGTAGQLLNKVIEKASKILQFHPKSIYTENAIMMLGKSFYYEKDYLKALREFQELVNSKPQSGFILEANLWIGKSQMRLKQYENALKTLVDVKNIAVEKKESDIFEEAYLEQIRYRVVTEDFDQAISVIIEFLKVSENDDLNSKASYELGELYFKRNDYLNSITAFQNVSKYSPSYDVSLDTKIALARAFRKSGDPQHGLDLMKEMRKELKYSDVYHRIDLEMGLCQIELKKFDDGIQTLMKIDTAFANTPSAGAARFELGKIYETMIPNYDSSYKYYQKAMSSSGADPLMIQAANDITTRFKKYQYIRSLVDENQIQIKYLVNPKEFIKDSTANADSIKHQEDLIKQSNTLNQNDQSINRNETGRYVPQNNMSTGINPVIVRKPLIRPTMSIDTLKANLVRNEYDLGNLFFTVMNRPDSASYFYHDILNNYPGSKYEADVLYALGSYDETVNNRTEADSIYNVIYDKFKTQKVVNAAATKLNKPLIDVEFDPAKQFYAEAESDMLKKDFNISLQKMFKISDTYPKSPIAPKALYASGWMLENDLKLNDSAAVVYDTLQARYPKSVYALKIRPKLYAYKDEIRRVQTAIADSLQKIELGKLNRKRLDSLANVKSQKVDSLDHGIKQKVDSLGNKKNLIIDSTGIKQNMKSDSLKNKQNQNQKIEPKINEKTGLKMNPIQPNILSLPSDTSKHIRKSTLDTLQGKLPGTPIDSLKIIKDSPVDSLKK